MRRIWRKIQGLRKTHSTILGIESSCDDTGCAVVNAEREILGECIRSQQKDGILMGGILPTMARDWHEENMDYVVRESLKNAGLTMDNIDAIAVTLKPGLKMSLVVGMNYAKTLSREYRKPFIPIHHMEAHALTARLTNERLEFPFLTLLISGGHCLLAVAQSIDKFIRLGEHIDNAPGEILDKLARRLKLHNLPHLRYKCGGRAVEEMARTGNTTAFQFPLPIDRLLNCDFSFGGIRSQGIRFIEKEEKKYELEGDEILPNADDYCASLQYSLIKHVCKRLQRGMEFVKINNLLPETNRSFVVSGGVACNSYFRRAFEILCESEGYQLYVPPAKYCNDNGVMIAWNGVERFQAGIGIYDHDKLDQVDVEDDSPLGEDYRDQVLKARITCKWIRLDELHTNTSKVSPEAVDYNVEREGNHDIMGNTEEQIEQCIEKNKF